MAHSAFDPKALCEESYRRTARALDVDIEIVRAVVEKNQDDFWDVLKEFNLERRAV